MAKITVNYGKIKEIVTKFMEANPLKEGERYTFQQMLDLDLELAPFAAEKMNTGKRDLAYYSYHTIWYVLRMLDPTITYDYSIIDYTNYNIEADKRVNAVHGLAINVVYKNNKRILDYTQENALAVRDSRMQALVDIKSDDIEFHIQRAFVKSIAFNTGLGYSCWLSGDYIVSVAGTGIETPKKVEAPKQEVASNGMVANVKPAAKPKKPEAPKVVEQVALDLTQPVEVEPVVTAPVVEVTPNHVDVTPVEVVAPTPAPVTKSRDELLMEFVTKLNTNANAQPIVANWFASKGRPQDLLTLGVEDLAELLTLI